MSHVAQQLAEDDFLNLTSAEDRYPRKKEAMQKRLAKLKASIPKESELYTKIGKYYGALPGLETKGDFEHADQCVDAIENLLDQFESYLARKQEKSKSTAQEQTEPQKTPQERIVAKWLQLKGEAVAVASGDSAQVMPMKKALLAYRTAAEKSEFDVQGAAQALKNMQQIIEEANSSTQPTPKQQQPTQPVTNKPAATEQQWNAMTEEARAVRDRVADLLPGMRASLSDQLLKAANDGTTYDLRCQALTKFKEKLLQLEQSAKDTLAECQQLITDTGRLLTALSRSLPTRFQSLSYQGTSDGLADETDPFKKRDGLLQLKNDLQTQVSKYRDSFTNAATKIEQDLNGLVTLAATPVQALREKLEALRQNFDCEGVVALGQLPQKLKEKIGSVRQECVDLTETVSGLIDNVAAKMGRANEFQNKLNPLASLSDVYDRKAQLGELEGELQECQEEMNQLMSEAAGLNKQLQASIDAIHKLLSVRGAKLGLDAKRVAALKADSLPQMKQQLKDELANAQSIEKKYFEAFRKKHDEALQSLNVFRGEAPKRVQLIEQGLAKALQDGNWEGPGGLVEVQTKADGLGTEIEQEKSACAELASALSTQIDAVAGRVGRTDGYQGLLTGARTKADVFERRGAIQQTRNALEDLEQQIAAADQEIQNTEPEVGDLLAAVRVLSANQLAERGYQSTFDALADETNPYTKRDALRQLKPELETLKMELEQEATEKQSNVQGRLEDAATYAASRIASFTQKFQQLQGALNLDALVELDGELDVLDNEANAAKQEAIDNLQPVVDLLNEVANALDRFNEFNDRFVAAQDDEDIFARRDEILAVRDEMQQFEQGVASAKSEFPGVEDEAEKLYKACKPVVLKRISDAWWKEFNETRHVPNVIDKLERMKALKVEIDKQSKKAVAESNAAVQQVKQSSEKLQALPTKSKINLVEQLAQGAQETKEARDEAIKTIWESIKDLEPKFEKRDKARRKEVLDALTNSQELADARDAWENGELDRPAKLKALKAALTLQCDKLFENNPQFAHRKDKPKPPEFELDNKPSMKISDTETVTEQGNYNPNDKKIHFNAVALDEASFTEALDTVIHENTHHYQDRLVEMLNAGELDEEDPEYDQARLFALNGTHYVSPPESKDEEDAPRTRKIYKEQPVEMHAWRAGTETRNLQFQVPSKKRLDQKESQITQRANPVIQKFNSRGGMDQESFNKLEAIQSDLRKLKNSEGVADRQQRIKTLQDYSKLVDVLDKM